MDVIKEVEVDTGGARPQKIQLCKDQAGEFRTRIIAGNGEPIFPPEGYNDWADAVDNLLQIEKVLIAVDLTELEPPAS